MVNRPCFFGHSVLIQRNLSEMRIVFAVQITGEKRLTLVARVYPSILVLPLPSSDGGALAYFSNRRLHNKVTRRSSVVKLSVFTPSNHEHSKRRCRCACGIYNEGGTAMPILAEHEKPRIRTRFEALRCPVRINGYIREHDCPASRQVYDLLMELNGLSPKIIVELFDLEANTDHFKDADVHQTPTLILQTEHGPGIRFVGPPKEYELAALLDIIEIIGTCSAGLRSDVLQHLDLIASPVHIKVFVTPSSPYCPSAVTTAMRLSVANRFITSEMVDISLFPRLGEKYGVHGVPKVVINEEPAFEGSLPEDLYVEEIFRVIGAPASPTGHHQ